jgi:hypothetical protein
MGNADRQPERRTATPEGVHWGLRTVFIIVALVWIGVAWAVHAGKKYPLGDTLAVAGVAAALVLVIAGVVVANWWEGRAARREAGASGGRSIRKLPYGGGNTRLLQAGGHALTCRIAGVGYPETYACFGILIRN